MSILPPHLRDLPLPPPAALELHARLEAQIREAIARAGGWLPFERFMALALYAPGAGYYSAGSVKLGAAGDFVTAPELTPLFARCLARQVAQFIRHGVPDVLEVGAGSGALAADLLEALAALDALPQRYLVLEVSAELRERQRALVSRRVPGWAARVEWLEALPEGLSAVVLANEVLDAMPTRVVRRRHGLIEEIGVSIDAASRRFTRACRPAAGELLAAAEALALPEDYETEVNLAARAFVASVAGALERGALIAIDYGFPAAEYYHPQRMRGTLMCHYRHHAHDDPFVLVGLQDITAHVDFSAIAEAGHGAGLAVLGYTSQAQFLVNCGVTEILATSRPEDVRTYAPLAAHAQKLLSPAEMGELFKVMVLGRGMPEGLLGFATGDRSHRL
jgi:SAM-dependent MidA family methyltransferase